MKYSIVLSAQPTRFEAVAFRGDFERNLAHIAALGYDGVELAIRDPALVDSQQPLKPNRPDLNLPMPKLRP